MKKQKNIKSLLLGLLCCFLLTGCGEKPENESKKEKSFVPGNSQVSFNLGDYEGAFLNGEEITSYDASNGNFKLPNALCEGYKFEGWYDNPSLLGKPLREIPKGVTQDFELYARFDDCTSKVFLYSGQSNASGTSWYENLKFRNLISEEQYNKYLSGFKNVKIDAFNDVTIGTNNTGVITQDFENVKFGYGYTSRNFGAEVGIAETLASEFPDEIVYITKFAKGSTRLSDQYVSPSMYGFEGPMYTGMLNKFDESIEKLLSKNLWPEICGFIWIQGESDASGEKDNKYLKLANNFISDVRDHFDSDYVSTNGISFIQVGISDHWNNYKVINDTKKAMADASNINYYLPVDNKEIYHYDQEGKPDAQTGEIATVDLSHYDSLSMLQIGHDCGKVCAEILNEGPKDIVDPDKNTYKTSNINIKNKFKNVEPTFQNQTDKIWIGREGQFIFTRYDFTYEKDIFKTMGYVLGTTPAGYNEFYFKISYDSWAGDLMINKISAQGTGASTWIFGSLGWRGMYFGVSHPFPKAGEKVSLYIICEPSKVGISSLPNKILVSDPTSGKYSGPSDEAYKDTSTYTLINL